MPLSKCHVCGGKINQKIVSTENWWGDVFTIVEGVPAFVCDNCGEQYFDAETSLMLDKMRQKKVEIHPKRVINVPVYEYPLKTLKI